jgi:alkaline phosphatase D
VNPVLDRRALLLAGAATVGVALLPWGDVAEAAVRDAARTVFGFGVASGDPTADAIVLWTRVTPSPDALPGSGKGKPVTVRWELAADEGFHRILKSGSVVATAARDHTVHVDVTGLPAYTRFYYRFTALGKTSAVGRTQTAPDEPGKLHALRFGFTSCANYTGGFFTGYRFLAQREDLDFVLFLGDYLYEYGNDADRYGPDELKGKRDHEPAVEMVKLQDYRQRHALYKTDPDLQAAHRRHPWILVFDDHEVCDNTWAGGANNHQPATEGTFAARRKAAYQAYLEWVPLRLPDQRGATGTRFWRRFRFGDLADLSVLETRQNRSEQSTSQDQTALSDPTRHLPEPAQMSWLTSGLKAPKTWHLLGNQVVLAQVRLPAIPAITGMLGITTPVPADGYVFNTDQWDGYAADQQTLLKAMSASTGDAVVLTGDIHSSWANDLPLEPGTYVPGVTGESAGVEFVCPSISSDGFYEVAQRQAAGAMALSTGIQAANRHVRFLEGIHHGVCVMDVTPARVQVDFVYATSTVHPEDPRLDALAVGGVGASWQSMKGSHVVSSAAAPLGARSDNPRVLAAPRRAAAPARPVSAPAASPAVSAVVAPRTLPTTGPSETAGVVAVGLLGAALALRGRGTRA